MDAGRQIGDLFTLWWEKHGDKPVAISQLDPIVEQLADPSAAWSAVSRCALGEPCRYAHCRVRSDPAGGNRKWGKATYALKRTAEDEDHREHRGHRARRKGTTAMAQTTRQDLTVL